MNNDDTRCCGTGTCMINEDGLCWCGQRWDGEKMCPPERLSAPAGKTSATVQHLENRSGASDD